MKMKLFLAFTILMMAFIPPPVFATDSTGIKSTDSVVLTKTDSSKATIPVDQITAPSNVTLFGLKVPVWVATILTTILAILPGIQLILKKIPSATPFEGLLGGILNFFTAFQKNVTVTPPPDPKANTP